MPAEEGDLSGRTVRSIAWVGIGRVAAQLVQTVTVIALMRLLTPEDFGVMAMVIVFTALATVLSSLGFSLALVQAPEASPKLLDTAFWSVLAISALAAGLVVLAAPAIESYYREPRLAGFTVWMAMHRSSPELCVKVRGSSSMLLLGCLGDLLRFEKREIQVATFAPDRSSP